MSAIFVFVFTSLLLTRKSMKLRICLRFVTEDISVWTAMFCSLPVLLALAVSIRKLSISNHYETNQHVMVRQQRSEVQMRQLIIGTPVIRKHYLTGFINSAKDE